MRRPARCWPLRQQTNTLGTGDADDGANLIDVRRGDDQRGTTIRAAGRPLESGDVVDARHEHRGDALEVAGESVGIHVG